MAVNYLSSRFASVYIGAVGVQKALQP